jgi:hypothetical protein
MRSGPICSRSMRSGCGRTAMHGQGMHAPDAHHASPNTSLSNIHHHHATVPVLNRVYSWSCSWSVHRLDLARVACVTCGPGHRMRSSSSSHVIRITRVDGFACCWRWTLPLSRSHATISAAPLPSSRPCPAPCPCLHLRPRGRMINSTCVVPAHLGDAVL